MDVAGKREVLGRLAARMRTLMSPPAASGESTADLAAWLSSRFDEGRDGGLRRSKALSDWLEEAVALAQVAESELELLGLTASLNLLGLVRRQLRILDDSRTAAPMPDGTEGPIWAPDELVNTLERFVVHCEQIACPQQVPHDETGGAPRSAVPSVEPDATPQTAAIAHPGNTPLRESEVNALFEDEERIIVDLREMKNRRCPLYVRGVHNTLTQAQALLAFGMARAAGFALPDAHQRAGGYSAATRDGGKQAIKRLRTALGDEFENCFKSRDADGGQAYGLAEDSPLLVLAPIPA